MFENIGGKIKAIAQIACVLGIAGSVIYGVCMFGSSFLLGLVLILVGSLISWIGSFALYGYGEMIEATCETRDMIYEIMHRRNADSVENVPADGWKCRCGRVNAPYVSSCVCGLTKIDAKNEATQAK